ncbi:hypothetical protein FKM82_021696 [Ascaphus truei]
MPMGDVFYVYIHHMPVFNLCYPSHKHPATFFFFFVQICKYFFFYSLGKIKSVVKIFLKFCELQNVRSIEQE